MAFNSWDKLEKAQRDYPKTKFAVVAVDKALKRQPNNPYLLVCYMESKIGYFADHRARLGRRILRSNLTMTRELSPILYSRFTGSQSVIHNY
jgi:hypothetical protein